MAADNLAKYVLKGRDECKTFDEGLRRLILR